MRRFGESHRSIATPGSGSYTACNTSRRGRYVIQNPFRWALRAIALAVVIGLSVYLKSVGLDKADRVGSAVGVVVALTALITPYLWPSERRGDKRTETAQETQEVADTTVGGSLVQQNDGRRVTNKVSRHRQTVKKTKVAGDLKQSMTNPPDS